MIGFFRRLLKDRRGNVLVITAAFMPVIIGAAGLATDTIEWTLWKRQLQRAADSAAIAGVYDRENASGGSTSNTTTAVCNDLAVNLHTWMKLQSSSTPCGASSTVGSYYNLSYPADSGSMTNQVSVTLHVQQALPFSSFFAPFGFSAPVITASATAASISTSTPCALALDSSGTAMDYSGNATVNAPTCVLYSDSSASNAASAGGSSSVSAQSIAAVGGIQQSNNWNVQSYIPYSPSISDPFSSITPDTTQMHCSSSALDDNTTFSGNTNCWSSISLQPNKTITVPSSISVVYVNGGNVDLKGTFSCTCTVVLTNTSTASNATIGTWTSNAQAQNTITAPTTGTYAGIAVYQDRRATGNTDKINGGSSNVITGAVYFPKDTLQINGTGTATSLCAMWVANNITFLGNSSIAISSPNDTACSGKVAGTSAAVKMVRLVS